MIALQTLVGYSLVVSSCGIIHSASTMIELSTPYGRPYENTQEGNPLPVKRRLLAVGVYTILALASLPSKYLH